MLLALLRTVCMKNAICVVAQCAWVILQVDAGGGAIQFDGLGVLTGRVVAQSA